MLLLEFLFLFIGIFHLVDSGPPRLHFQHLLDTCTNPKYLNSTQCQYFFSTYPWRNDDILSAFNKLRYTDRAHRSPAWNNLEERLIHLLRNPNFDLASLGESSFRSAVIYKNETLAIAIWNLLEKYKNYSRDFYFNTYELRFHYPDLQIFECRQSMSFIVERNMLQLLKKMVTDQPECLLQYDHTMLVALSTERCEDTREFLINHGLEITPSHFQYRLPREVFEWALLYYRHSNSLIKNSIPNGHEVVAIAVWEFLKQKNYIELLCQISNNTVFDVVKSNKVELLNTMLRDCPDGIYSNGNSFMEIAIKKVLDTLPMIQLLILYGVEIPPNLFSRAQSIGYTGKIDWAIFDYHQLLTQRKKLEDNIVYDYFIKAVEKNKKVICHKILAQNISASADIVAECLV